MSMTEAVARARGNALAGRLGVGWNPVVWENLGWHYSAKCGCADLFERRGVRRVDGWDRDKISGYTVYFNSTKKVLGKGATAHEALEQARAKVATIISGLTHDLQFLNHEE